MLRALPGLFSTLVQNELSQAIPGSQIPPAPDVLIFQLPPWLLLGASTCSGKVLAPGQALQSTAGRGCQPGVPLDLGRGLLGHGAVPGAPGRGAKPSGAAKNANHLLLKV